MKVKACCAFFAASCALAADELQPFDVKVMRPASYATENRDEYALADNPVPRNLAKRLDELEWGTPGEVALVALPDDTLPWLVIYRGFRVLLVNRTGSEVSFQAVDSSVYVCSRSVRPQRQLACD